jgi:hypothetical protein
MVTKTERESEREREREGETVNEQMIKTTNLN